MSGAPDNGKQLFGIQRPPLTKSGIGEDFCLTNSFYLAQFALNVEKVL